jgi:3-isopropylmalate/(R)-2-methylmalate dehydratase large subunit
MTIACGDSYTSTHGALGALQLGIGTCATCSRAVPRARSAEGAAHRSGNRLSRGVFAKDLILTIRRLGVHGGVGFARYGGATLDAMTIDERMTVCNMSIEGGARIGYVNPDETTFAFCAGRLFAPRTATRRARGGVVAADGVRPGRALRRSRPSTPPPSADRPRGASTRGSRSRFQAIEAAPTTGAGVHGVQAGSRAGARIDVAFIGSAPTGASRSCGGGAHRQGHHAAKHVKALVVPDRAVSRAAEARGLDEVFKAAGSKWRGAGCSMCRG